MNIELLKQVRDIISTSTTFDMNSWTNCIAGVTCQIFNLRVPEEHIFDFAQGKLDLTRIQAVELFLFFTVYQERRNDRQVAIRQIDGFIEKYNQIELIPYTEEMSQDDDKLVEGV